MKKEQTYKILINIKPFNEFQFISCYYHQMIAAYSHFNVDKRLILMNYFPQYKFDHDNNELKINDLKFFSEQKMEQLTGLHLIKKRRNKKFINDIIKSIDRGQPCIVCVDCFYLDYREDTYKKQHVPHFILVYAYDKIKKEFLINEHMHTNSIYYVEKIVSFNLIKKAYKQYEKRLAKSDGYGIIKIKRLRKIDFDINSLDFFEIYKSRRDEIESGLSNAIKGMEFIINCMMDEGNYKTHIDKIIEFTGIIRGKKVCQKFQLKFLKMNENIIAKTDRIIENYIFIYGIVVKIKYTNSYSKLSIEKMVARCQEIINLEKEVHELYLGGSL